jgi:hypothetical protein
MCNYLVAVDGLSVLFLPATALLFLASLVASWNSVRDAPRFYYSLLLLFQTCSDAGHLLRARYGAVLRFLGADAGPDLLPARPLGGVTAAAGGRQRVIS